MLPDDLKVTRRCTATTRAGEPCKAFACRGDVTCGRHGGRSRTAPPTCRCIAYAWPHRPGGGLCRWPDAPLHRSTIPAGTHTRRRRTRFRGMDGMAAFFGTGRPPALADYWAEREADEDAAFFDD